MDFSRCSASLVRRRRRRGRAVQPAAARLCRHAKFPTSYFTLCPGWSRKGFLHTRWRVQGRALELVNVHLFADESNLRALERGDGPGFIRGLSMFASARLGALRAVLDGIAVSDRPPPTHHHEQQQQQPPPEALDVTDPTSSEGGKGAGSGDDGGGGGLLVFLFGDFNFRLDLCGVVRHVCGERGLEQARSHSSSLGSLRLGANGCAVTEASALMVAAGASEDAAETPAAATAGGAAPAEAEALEIDTKLFALRYHAPLLKDGATVLRPFDCELSRLNEVPQQQPGAATRVLHELPVSFLPTYMRAAKMTPAKAKARDAAGTESGGHNEKQQQQQQQQPLQASPSKAAAAAVDATHAAAKAMAEIAAQPSHPPEYGNKRCPAWTDRVLMDAKGLACVCEPGAAAEYASSHLPSETISCDHDVVHLAFSLR